MFNEEPGYEYSKDGPLAQTRVPEIQGAAPVKDILAAYDEIFAWGGEGGGESKIEPSEPTSLIASSQQIQEQEGEIKVELVTHFI
jgi:hypothetical protein